MCDYYFQRMDGDLADVVRASGRSTDLLSNPDDVELLPGDDPASWQQQLNRDFGDPFAYVSDPLLSPFAAYCVGGGGYGRDQQQLLAPPPEKASSKIGGTSLLPQLHPISPPSSSSSPRMMRPTPAVASGEMMMKVTASAAATCGPGVQISPHGASPGIKRRKSQVKKVVCIPAPPAAATGINRQSAGEVVPSDLWAWRKYGQKPIKGSPYPRGYYRCSSSKGCSARKQVERSRTEPNMLVITYTSEHNHPWPTQRNALAGSIRSHLSKSSSQRPPSMMLDVEPQPMAPGQVKEEASEKPPDDDQFDYKPLVPEPEQPDDFFSDLAELESDPMSIMFSNGFEENKRGEEETAVVAKAAADPLFSMFDWDTGSS